MTSIELATRSAEIVKAASLHMTKVERSAPWMMRIEEHPSWQMLARLEVTLQVGVALHRFTVKNLLALKEGQVIESLAPATDDVPLNIGHVQLGWSEFEVMDQRMALRLTRLG
ncbi:MAG: FliM/FliN family flagellar motor C-terminal domain-containing protein [Acidobacteriota bacterium]|nr:FliM/FliN family flagellar motor C-terminal domain-containing protein [Acidobacteriota bacterium]